MKHFRDRRPSLNALLDEKKGSISDKLVPCGESHRMPRIRRATPGGYALSIVPFLAFPSA